MFTFAQFHTHICRDPLCFKWQKAVLKHVELGETPGLLSIGVVLSMHCLLQWLWMFNIQVWNQYCLHTSQCCSENWYINGHTSLRHCNSVIIACPSWILLVSSDLHWNRILMMAITWTNCNKLENSEGRVCKPCKITYVNVFFYDTTWHPGKQQTDSQ